MDNVQTSLEFLVAEINAPSGPSRGSSLRQFAAQAGVSASLFSRLLSGQRKLSHKVATKIAQNLMWSSDKQEYLLSLINLETAASENARQSALAQIYRLQEAGAKYKEVKPDQFSIIAKWYHGAILELATFPEFTGNPNDIAKRLGITPIQADLALERLKRIGALKQNHKKWEVSFDHITAGGVPSPAIRSYHKEVLDLAKAAIESQPIKQRHVSAVTMAIDPSKLELARELIGKFRRDLTKLLNSPSEQRAIYQLSIQLFQLDDGLPKKAGGRRDDVSH